VSEGKGREGKGRERKGREGKGREGKGREGKGRSRKGREGKEQEGKGREGKGREGNGDGACEHKCNIDCCISFHLLAYCSSTQFLSDCHKCTNTLSLTVLQFRLVYNAQIRAHFLPPLGEQLSCFFIIDSGNNYDVIPILPPNRGSDLVVFRELERVQHTQYLVKVATARRGVRDGKSQLLVRANDEDAAYICRKPLDYLIFVEHPIQSADTLVFISEDGVVGGTPLSFRDILGPGDVIIYLR
jgi:hypothetical protein